MWYRVCIGLCLGVVATGYAQQRRDFRAEALMLKTVLWNNHIQPPPLDDNFSAAAFDLFFETIDPDKLHLTEADLAPLRKYRTLLDDELNRGPWGFLNQVLPVYRRSLERSESIVRQFAQTPFTGDVKEYITFDTLHWPKTAVEGKNFWRLWLKYQTFDRLADLRKGAVTVGNEFFAAHEPQARAHVCAFELRSIKRILNNPHGFENRVADTYLQCIAAVLDAHTTYMPATEMENFLSSLSTEGYYFGLTLDETERGELAIAALAPGGPAWKSGALHVNDVVENLQWEGQEPITGVSLEEANDILADANHHTMEFTVRTASGLTTSVKLRKEKISVEENFVRSYLLVGKYRIGYISLPDFYTQWGDASEGSRCANDVAKEIMKLRKENIDGLILDVRYNGGGSLHEAMALAGIFIDEGPMGILKDRDATATVLKDVYRGTVYDGPMILQVNAQSASASEFLAAVLQDYNRAVIVGSRTFGKATAQNFFPLNPAQKEPTLDAVQNGPGYASITTDKIYRVTGRTVQGHGLTPDVMLPDVMDALDMHEASMAHALPADSVSKRTFYKPLKTLPVTSLRQQSEARCAASPSFQALRGGYAWLKGEMEKEYAPVSLLWKESEAEAQQHAAHYKKLELALAQPATAYEVLNTDADTERMLVDEYATEFNKRWLATLKNDIYVEEAFYILGDLIDRARHVAK